MRRKTLTPVYNESVTFQVNKLDRYAHITFLKKNQVIVEKIYELFHTHTPHQGKWKQHNRKDHGRRHHHEVKDDLF